MKVNKIFLIFLLLLLKHNLCINYVSSGSFESPAVPTNGYLFANATGWHGSNFEVLNMYSSLGYGQYIDLQASIGQNGYIEQGIDLPSEGNCTLSFLQQARSINYASYVMEIYWNGILQTTNKPNTTATTFQTLTLYGVQGNNLLKFQQIGDDSDSNGMFLDEVSLTCTLVSRKQSISSGLLNLKYVMSVIFSTPFNQVSGFRFVYFFAEDLWLNNYDKIEHKGVLNIVFNTTATIQSMKFEVFDSNLHWQNLKSNLSISDYLPYTRKKFIQIQDSSSVLIKAAFPFFIYTIPQNILICLILYLLFRILQNYKASLYFRKFYFIKTTILQTLIEGNVAYFTYVCFGHLSISFHFRFGDKMAVLFTVLFLWLVLVFTVVFYPLVGSSLGKKAGYFLSHIYRCNSGYFILAAKNLARNFLRGTISYFFHQFYPQQLLFLSVSQIILLVIMISLESTNRIFLTKSFFVLWVIYHTQLILLNGSLYFQYFCEKIYGDDRLKSIAVQIQGFVIYLLIGTLFFIVVRDFSPTNWSNSRKDEQIQSLVPLKQSKNNHKQQFKQKGTTQKSPQNTKKQKSDKKTKQPLEINEDFPKQHVGKRYFNNRRKKKQNRMKQAQDRRKICEGVIKINLNLNTVRFIKKKQDQFFSKG